MIKKGTKMKKLLLVGFLLIGQFGNAKIDVSKLFVDSNNGDNNSNSRYNATNEKIEDTGDADRLIKNITGQDPKIYQQGATWGAWGGRWTDPETLPIGETCDSDGKNCQKIYAPTPSQKEMNEKKQKRRNNLIQAYFEDISFFPTQDIGLKALDADIQALQKRIGELRNDVLKARLNDFLLIAKTVSNIMNTAIINDKNLEVFNGFKPSVSGNRVSQALAEAESALKSADFNRDSASRLTYVEVIKRLDAINLEVQKLKKHHNNSVKEALEKANEELVKINRAQLRSNINSQEYVQYATKIDLYNEIIAELKLEEADLKDVGTKAKEDVELITKAVDQAKAACKNNPIKALELAESDLLDMNNRLITLETMFGNRPSDAVSDQKKLINLQHKVIAALKNEVKTFNIKVQKKIDEKVQKAQGNRQKALEYLVTQDKGYGFLGNAFVWNKEQVLEDQINNIQDPVEQQAARELKKQNDSGFNNSNNSSSNNVSAVASSGNPLENASYQLLSQFGLTVDQLNDETRQELARVLAAANQDTRNIIENSQLTIQEKQREKNLVGQKMIKDLTQVILTFKTGVSSYALDSRDPQLIAMEAGTNYLVNKLMPQVPANNNLSNYNF